MQGIGDKRPRDEAPPGATASPPPEGSVARQAACDVRRKGVSFSLLDDGMEGSVKARDAAKVLVGSISVYVLVAACAGQILTEPVPDAAAEPTSGKRLKRKFRVGEDGSKEVVQVTLTAAEVDGSPPENVRGVWYDSERKEDCVFRLAADGAERCLPFARTGLLYFSDDACTKHVAGITSGVSDSCPQEAAPQYLAVDDSPSKQCEQDPLKFGITIYALGAERDEKLPVYYLAANGICTSFGVGNPAPRTFELKGEVPATSFVKATITVDP